MVAVPNAYQQYVQQAASGTGLPFDVVAAQAQAESNFNSRAVSSTGAEGWLQFEPSTYNAYAGQAGVSPGTEFNVADETKVYIVYMNSLLKEEGGNIFKALEAYNAGPGNLNAGAGYATGILQNAGVSQANLTSETIKIPGGGLPVIGPLIGAANQGLGFATDPAGTIINDLTKGLLDAFGIGTLKDLFQRLGLILFGVGLIFIGIHVLSKGSSKTVINMPAAGNRPNGDEGESTSETKESTKKISSQASEATGGSSVAASAGGESVGAGEAVEAALVA